MIASFIIPIFILIVFIYGIYNKIDVFKAFAQGVVENLKVAVEIFPALLGLVVCVGLLKSSGILSGLALVISPLTQWLGFPSACVPLAIIKPISGSGSTAVLSDILKTHGADSFSGRVASVIAGASETVFYTTTIYSAELKAKIDFRVIFSAIFANFTAIVLSSLVVKLYFY